MGLGPKIRNYSSNLRMDFKVFGGRKFLHSRVILGQFIASFIGIVKFGIDRCVCGQLCLWIPGDGSAQFVGNIAKSTGRAGAVSDFYGDDGVFSLADAVDEIDVVGAKAEVFGLFAEL